MKQILQSKTKTTKNVQHIHINTKEIVQSVFFMLLYFSTTDAEESLVSLSQWPLPLWWQKPRPPNVQAVGKQWEQPPTWRPLANITDFSPSDLLVKHHSHSATRVWGPPGGKQLKQKQANEETSVHFTQLPIFPLFCRLLAAINQHHDKVNLSGFRPRRPVIDQLRFQLHQEWAGWASVRLVTTIEKNPEICYSYLPYYLSFSNSYLKKKTLSFGQHTIHWIPVSTG